MEPFATDNYLTTIQDISNVRILYRLSFHQYFLPDNSSSQMDFRWTQNNRAEVTIAQCFRIQSEQYRAEREAAAGQYIK